MKHLSATQCIPAAVHIHPFAGYYLALSQIYNSQQMDICWLADKQLCWLFAAKLNCEGVD